MNPATCIISFEWDHSVISFEMCVAASSPFILYRKYTAKDPCFFREF